MAMAPGECFIDIGANLGLFTMVASRHLGPEGRVVAFEPNQTTFADLAGNLAANNCTNVVTVCAGVSNATARVAFDPGPAGSQRHRPHQRKRQQRHHGAGQTVWQRDGGGATLLRL